LVPAGNDAAEQATETSHHGSWCRSFCCISFQLFIPLSQVLLLLKNLPCCCCLAAAVTWNHLLLTEGLLDGSIRENHEDAAVSAWWNPKHDLESSFEMLKSSWLNVLLVAAPLGIVAHAMQWQATTVFLLVRVLMHRLCSIQHMQHAVHAAGQ
jgi:hypothetical protein